MPQTEISWRMVVVIGLLLAGAIALTLMGEKTLAASLTGGLLGYLAQGFGKVPPSNDNSGKVIDSLQEISEKLTPKPPAGAARVQAVPIFAAVGMTWILMFLGR